MFARKQLPERLTDDFRTEEILTGRNVGDGKGEVTAVVLCMVENQM